MIECVTWVEKVERVQCRSVRLAVTWSGILQRFILGPAISDVLIYATDKRKISMLIKFDEKNLEAPIIQKMIMVLYGKDWMISKTKLIGTK